MASGTVYRRDSGTWASHATWVESGRRRQLKRSGFATKRAAQQALTALLADHQRGQFVQPRKLTVGEYLEGWLDGLANQGRRESTVDSYRRSLRTHVLPAIGNAELQA